MDDFIYKDTVISCMKKISFILIILKINNFPYLNMYGMAHNPGNVLIDKIVCC